MVSIYYSHFTDGEQAQRGWVIGPRSHNKNTAKIGQDSRGHAFIHQDILPSILSLWGDASPPLVPRLSYSLSRYKLMPFMKWGFIWDLGSCHYFLVLEPASPSSWFLESEKRCQNIWNWRRKQIQTAGKVPVPRCSQAKHSWAQALLLET